MASMLPPMATVGVAGLTAIAAAKDIRHAVGVYTFLTNKAKPVLPVPAYMSYEATVIIPTTLKEPDKLMDCIKCILKCNPAIIFVVTAESNMKVVADYYRANLLPEDMLKIVGVEKLNKRAQILAAMPYVKTDITILADDDVFWPKGFLTSMLAIFEDPEVGAGGPRQRVKRNEVPDVWNMLGISYLERRVFNNCATNAIDGSISTLSGRTAAYRSKILQDPSFEYYFLNDTWRGKPLNSDDDKCLTRWVYKEGWKIALQWDAAATIETTVEGDVKYLDQCMRWARAHWRGNFTVMENETYWCSRKYFWGFWYIYVGQFQTPSLLIDWLRFWFLSMILNSLSISGPRVCGCYLAMLVFLVIDKNIKMLAHFRKYPRDLKFVPALMMFSYIHGFLNIRALMTMERTHWGTQKLEVLQEARIGTSMLALQAEKEANHEQPSRVKVRSTGRIKKRSFHTIQ